MDDQPAGVGDPGRLDHQRPRVVAAADRDDDAARPQGELAGVAVEQRGEDAGRVEAWEAEPLDRAVEGDQRARYGSRRGSRSRRSAGSCRACSPASRQASTAPLRCATMSQEPGPALSPFDRVPAPGSSPARRAGRSPSRSTSRARGCATDDRAPARVSRPCRRLSQSFPIHASSRGGGAAERRRARRQPRRPGDGARTAPARLPQRQSAAVAGDPAARLRRRPGRGDPRRAARVVRTGAARRRRDADRRSGYRHGLDPRGGGRAAQLQIRGRGAADRRARRVQRARGRPRGERGRRGDRRHRGRPDPRGVRAAWSRSSAPPRRATRC